MAVTLNSGRCSKSAAIMGSILILLLLLGGNAGVDARRRRGRKKLISEDVNKNNATATTPGVQGRQGKLLSLFNVINFSNDACRANDPSRIRNGTCFSTSECRMLGGVGMGHCAAGFGICCVFTMTTGGSFSQNCTYLQNPGFPSSFTGSQSITYTANKLDSSVCSLRLDFESFSIRGMSDSLENVNSRCIDTLTLAGTGGSQKPYPVICGVNNGQHVYIDIGRSRGDTATITFALGSTGAAVAAPNVNWDIKATQIPCKLSSAPPEGCFQHHMGVTGTIQTFNFDATAESHLSNQDYAVCIRPERGFCCVQYSACSIAMSFSLYAGDTMLTRPLEDEGCTEDYIVIRGGSSLCTPNSNFELHSRFCGAALNVRDQTARGAAPGAGGTDLYLTVGMPVCDCTTPFRLQIVTNDLSDDVILSAPDATTAIITVTGGLADNTAVSKGLCLNYVHALRKFK